MRIGLVCPYSLSVPGGVQGQVMGLARAYAARGHDVAVLGPCDAPPVEPWVVPVGASVLNPSNGSLAPIAPDLGAQLRTLRALRDHHFDVVHLHEPLVPGPCATTLVMKPAPLVGTFHAAGDASDYESFSWVARPLGHRLDAFVAVSEEARAMAEPTLGGRWEVLFNGVDLPRFATASPWPRPDGRRVVLFVGRHEERKGLAVLLEAVGRLPDDVVVWIAGDGPQTAELQARYGDGRLEWLGRIPDEERDRRMAAADAFCAPSLGGESFGVILLEAMAAGAPVVAAAIRGYERVAGPLEGSAAAALLPPPGDPDALAAALTEVLERPDRASTLAAAGRARAAHFSLDHLADAYLELYRTLPAGRAGRRPSTLLGGWRASLS